MLLNGSIGGIIGIIVCWFIVLVFLGITIIMLKGKGSKLVAGYNMKSESEKALYPFTEETVSKNAGKVMLIVTLCLIAFTLFLQFVNSREVIISAAFIFGVTIILIVIIPNILNHIRLKNKLNR